MNLEDYLKFAKTTAVYPQIVCLQNPTEDQIKRCIVAGVDIVNISWIYPLIGLLGEAGELANKLKKTIRDDNFLITMQKRKEIIDEGGDLEWYKAILLDECRIDPNYVLAYNIAKLKERQKKNTVHDPGNRKE